MVKSQNKLAIDTTIEYRGFYISRFNKIYDNHDSMATLFKYIQQQKFNRIMEYDLGDVLRNTNNYGAISSFNTMARTQHGITQVAAVVGSFDDFAKHILPYNLIQTSPVAAYNYVNLESEFWNNDCTWPQYAQRLHDIHLLAQQQNPPMGTELYIGWLTPGQEDEQADTLVKYTDRILVHDYTKTPNLKYIQSRLDIIGRAALRRHKVQNIIILFDSDISHKYFKTHSFSYAYHQVKDAFNAANLPGKAGVNIIGFAEFKQ